MRERLEALDLVMATDAEMTAAIAAHAGAGDPHTGYQRESEKGLANGYAGLGADGLVPSSQLPGSTAVLGAIKADDGGAVWASPANGGALSAMSTTAARLAVTVPASGKLIAILSFYMTFSGNFGALHCGLMEGAATVVTRKMFAVNPTQADVNDSLAVDATFVITGLSPGAHTFDAGHRAVAASAVSNVYHSAEAPFAFVILAA